MEITEVRLALREGTPRPAQALGGSPGPASSTVQGTSEGREGEKRLKAYATVTFDRCFVVRNLKIIEGKSGLFVAMPSHKPKVTCERCHFKNDLGGRFCSQCGSSLNRPMDRPRAPRIEGSESQAHRDIAHPITVEFRQYLQQKILAAYEAERAKGDTTPALPGQAPQEAL